MQRPATHREEVREVRLVGDDGHLAAAEQLDLVQDLPQDAEGVARRGQAADLSRPAPFRLRGGAPQLRRLRGVGAPRHPEEDLCGG